MKWITAFLSIVSLTCAAGVMAEESGAFVAHNNLRAEAIKSQPVHLVAKKQDTSQPTHRVSDVKKPKHQKHG